MNNLSFPDNKKFAFTIFDDTDGAQIDNIKPIYELLFELNIFTTKSVWTLPSDNKNDPEYNSFTLDDNNYLEFIKELHNNGFEISFHNASSISSVREQTIEGIEIFKKKLGFYPKSFATHNNNIESLYWGMERFNSKILKFLMRFKRGGKNFSQGHMSNSLYFWGDICKSYISYVRNFVFKEINVLRINQTLPYHDPKKPYVTYWFSSSDGGSVKNFNELLSEKNQEKLEREKGVCIVYTHFAHGFVNNGIVNKTTEILLRKLAKRNGWFVPASQLLDYLKSVNDKTEIGLFERIKMEYLWALSKFIYGTN